MNYILLAAGRGSRLSELTTETHKSLLHFNNKPVLEYIVDAIINTTYNEIIVVTGYRKEDIEAFIRSKYGKKIKTVYNQRYLEDTNILSVNVGVSALAHPELGYLIIETDIVLEPEGWSKLLSRPNMNQSEWTTVGRYSRDLTGGALRSDIHGNVKEIVYAPVYNKCYEGWNKLLGTLYVGPSQVECDRILRNKAINVSIAQYYLMPWIENLNLLPCKCLDLSNYYAASFNDLSTYNKIEFNYKKIIRSKPKIIEH